MECVSLIARLSSKTNVSCFSAQFAIEIAKINNKYKPAFILTIFFFLLFRWCVDT